MSKSVLISIKSGWCKKIINGEKKFDVRKTKPNIETPFPCYIYCTKGATINDNLWITDLSGYNHLGNGKVIGEFICDYIVDYRYPFMYSETDCSVSLTELCRLSVNEVWEYGKGKTLYGWHISDLKIYDEPKKLSELRTYNPGVVLENGYPVPTYEIKRPPQSWYYVEERWRFDRGIIIEHEKE